MMANLQRAAGVGTLFVIVSLFGLSLTGCGGDKDGAYGEIASIYADVLVAQLMYGDDSVRREKIVDSIVNLGGYESIDDLYGGIATITADDPRGVRILLDSTQARLEKMRDAKPKVVPNDGAAAGPTDHESSDSTD